MGFFKHPDTFCADSRPYWALFVCFILCNLLLIYTLYTRQPERYRRVSRWFTFESQSLPGPAEGQAAALAVPGGRAGAPNARGGVAQIRDWLVPGPPSPKRTVAFGGMTLGEASANQASKRDPGDARYGVEVLSIDKKSVPYLCGVRKGDVIVSVNRLPTRTAADFEAVVRNLDTAQGILFDVYRNGRFYYVTVETRYGMRW